MTNKIIAVGVAVLVGCLAWASWMFRYLPLNPGKNEANPVVLDRWTGKLLSEYYWSTPEHE